MNNLTVLIIGVGFVGLTTGLCYVEKGLDVIFYDKDKEKIAKLNNKEIPFFEPGLQELLNKHYNSLEFSSDLINIINFADVIIICVGTGTNKDGSPDMSNIYSATEEIGKKLQEYNNCYKLIVQKSTGKPGTCKKIEEILLKYVNKNQIDVISMPEFLREGNAVYDVFHPEKSIIIGINGELKKDYHVQIASVFQEPILFVSRESAELIKLAHNGFSAIKISYINLIALLCNKYKANIHDLERALEIQIRRTHNWVRAGIGFGGSCLPKNVQDLLYLVGKDIYYNDSENLFYGVLDINDYMIHYIINIILNFGLEKKDKITIWGLSFKPNSSDTRHSRAIELIKSLSRYGYRNISVYDPVVKNCKEIDNICNFSFSSIDSIKDSKCLILCTEWNQFKNEKMNLIFGNMSKDEIPILIDGRNIWKRDEIEHIGFKYFGIGK